MENHGFDQVSGHSPFLNALAHRCGLAAAYHAVAHPSLPNYLALTSGSTQGLVGQDCSPGSGCQSGGPSIFSQTPWRAYAESMTGRCALTNSGDYAARHNPAVYYTRVKGECATADVPLTELPGDLRSGRLSPYTFIAPNLCSDEHNCARLQRRCVAGAVDAAADRLGGLPAGRDRHLHHLRRGRLRRGQPRLHRRGRAGRCAPGPCPRRRSRTTRCCARTSSCWACRRSARRRLPHRWRRPSTSPADAPERPRCANDPVLPSRPDGEDTDHRREAVGRPGLRAGARRRLRRSTRATSSRTSRSSRGRSAIWSSWPSRRTTTRRSSAGRSRPCRCSPRRSSCGPTRAARSSST